MILGHGSIAGTVDSSAEKAVLADGVTYLYCADVGSVIRYTTAAGSDATATPAAGDIFVAPGVPRLVRANNGNNRLSVVRRTIDGVYTLTPLIGI